MHKKTTHPEDGWFFIDVSITDANQAMLLAAAAGHRTAFPMMGIVVVVIAVAEQMILALVMRMGVAMHDRAFILLRARLR